jgi:hypothetical protein
VVFPELPFVGTDSKALAGKQHPSGIAGRPGFTLFSLLDSRVQVVCSLENVKRREEIVFPQISPENRQ